MDYSLDGVARESNQGAKSRLTFVLELSTRYQYAIADTGES
jgi:hypothetical protein